MNTYHEWPRVKLEKYVDLITGYPFKSAEFTEESNGIPLVKGENVHQAYIDWKQSKYWPKEKLHGLDKYWLGTGDVLLAMDRPWIEAGLKYAWIKDHDPKALLVQRVARMRGINGLATNYLRYLIASQAFTDYIKPIVTGVSVPHISPAQIKGFQFRLPPYPTQVKIAAILSSYDDLIENNNRRIFLLEEMTQQLYREWFVRLRFPGCEKVHNEETKIGLIPSTWVHTTVEDCTSLLRRGITPKYDDSASKTVINQKCVRDFSLDMSAARRHSKAYADELNIAYGDVLINSTGAGTLGRVAQNFDNMKDTTVDSHITIVRPQVAIQCYVGSFLKFKQPELMALGTGSTNQTELNRDIIKKMDLYIPPASILHLFENAVKTWMDFKVSLQKKSAVLKGTRDLLLPLLISGDIDVSELDIVVRE